MTQSNITHTDVPPYPRLGEIYRAFAGALDTKNSDRDVDRLAREGDFDWSLLPKLKEELFLAPLCQYTDETFAKFIGQFISETEDCYKKLVMAVPLDGLCRDEVLPLLIENYFCLYGAKLIFAIQRKFGGPDLNTLLDSRINPISVVFDWADKDGAVNLAKTAYPGTTGEDNKYREKISRWAQGIQLPDISSIKLFTDALSKHGSDQKKAVVPNLRRWLIIARALICLDQDTNQMPIRDVMHRHLLCGLPAIDIGLILSSAVQEASEKFAPMRMPGDLLHEHLKRTSIKVDGDQAKTKSDLEEFERLTAKHDPEGRTQYHLEWLKGRWHVLVGNFEDALPYYEKAAELAYYLAGENWRKIVEEAFVLAGHLGKKAFLKQLKHRAVAFGLFPNPRGDDLVEEWEIEQLGQQFSQHFPIIGYFREAQTTLGTARQLPFLLWGPEEIENKTADLKNPDRVVAIRFSDGQVRRWPQLQFYIITGQIAEVKALLDKGASVDQLNKSGGSTLLCAIQRAIDTGERDALDLILQCKHAKATLDSRTPKKHLTPLICAVEYGEPDVVEKLLKMGASADCRGNMIDQTPLYICMQEISTLRNPRMLYGRMLKAMQLSEPDLIEQDTLRRYAVSYAGIMGDVGGIKAAWQNPEYRKLLEEVIAAQINIKLARHSFPKLLKIVESLLEHGANPNAEHHYPLPGRTPLMLAAETDFLPAFESMMKRGGDIYKKDAAGDDCIRIAMGFRSGEVVRYIRREGMM